MRKQDLKVGEEYAAGSSSRFDRWRLSRVKVVDLSDGIRVELRQEGDQYEYPRWLRGKMGETRSVASARDLIMPWAAYASGKAEHDRRAFVADGATSRLAVLGIDVYRLNPSSAFVVEPDTMAAILALVPDGHDAP